MNHNFAIPVKNLKELKKFYEILGFRVFNRWHKPKEKLKALWMKNDDNCIIELVYYDSKQEIKFPKIPESLHLSLLVKNISATIFKLQKHKVKIIKPTTKGKTVKFFAFIQDPNGFLIEISQQ